MPSMDLVTPNQEAYLTPQDVAKELGGMSVRNVYKLIEKEELPTLKRSQRGTVVPRWGLEAYLRKINGKPSRVADPVHLDVGVLSEDFRRRAGDRSPQEWYAAFRAGDIPDTSENMTLLVQAVALGAGVENAPAPVTRTEAPWAAAAFTEDLPQH